MLHRKARKLTVVTLTAALTLPTVVSSFAFGAGKPPSQRSRSATTYVVKSGDTLIGIASRNGLTVSQIRSANPRLRTDVVRLGATLTLPKAVRASGLPGTLRANPERLKIRKSIRKWAARNDIPADLVEATLYLESGWNQSRVSSTGAIGVGQLMPGTTEFIKLELIGRDAGGHRLSADVTDHNVRMSARYLRHLLKITNGNTTRALYGYYQGFGSISENGLYAETRQYAASIQALRARFRADLSGT